ncbi:MAG: hypothetical protein ACJ76Z_08880 [Thermoleophilaceae bacterium]
MYEVLCERCWNTETVDADARPDYDCPACGAHDAWLGPFAQAPQRFSRRDSWPVLTSPLYLHAGQADRRTAPR